MPIHACSRSVSLPFLVNLNCAQCPLNSKKATAVRQTIAILLNRRDIIPNVQGMRECHYLLSSLLLRPAFRFICVAGTTCGLLSNSTLAGSSLPFSIGCNEGRKSVSSDQHASKSRRSHDEPCTKIARLHCILDIRKLGLSVTYFCGELRIQVFLFHPTQSLQFQNTH